MKGAVLVALALLGLAAADDRCRLEGVHTRAEVESCFKTVGWESREAMYKHYDNVHKFLRMSAYTDVLLDPPAPYRFTKMNMTEEWQQLKEGDNGASEFATQMKLKGLYNRVYDPHLSYNLPRCYSKFSYNLYAYPKLTTATGGMKTIAVLRLDADQEENYRKFLARNAQAGVPYASVEQLKSYEGKEIEKIQGMPLREFYSDFINYSYRSKDLGATINYVDRLEISMGTGKFPHYDQLVYTFKEDGTSLTVPYIYTSAVHLSEDEFKQYCYTGKLPSGTSQELLDVFETMDRQERNLEYDVRPLLRYMRRQRGGSDGAEEAVESARDAAGASMELAGRCTGHVTVGEGVMDGDVVYWVDMYTCGTDKVVVFVLKTFNIGDLSVLQAMHGDLVKARDMGATKLVIDLRGNGGGIAELSMTILRWVNNDAAGVAGNVWRRVRNEHADAGSRAEIDDLGDLRSPRTTQMLGPNHVLETSEPLFFQKEDAAGRKGARFAVDFSAPFKIDTGVHVDNGKPVIEDLDILQPIFSLDRGDVIGIGDGIDASASCFFLWGLKMLRLGTVVTVGGFNSSGGRDDADQDILAGFGTACGASVINSADLLQAARDKQLSDPALPSDLAHGTTVGITFLTALCYDDLAQLQEFREPVGDFNIPFHSERTGSVWPDHKREYPAFLEDHLLDIFDRHGNREGPYAHSGVGAPCKAAEHAVYGRLWDEATGTYAGECSFMYCKHPYFYNYATDTCETYDAAPAPSPAPTPAPAPAEPGESTTGYIVAVSILAALLAVALAFSVMAFVVLRRAGLSPLPCRRGRPAGAQGLVEEPEGR